MSDFLDDLDELGDDEDEVVSKQQSTAASKSTSKGKVSFSIAGKDEEDDDNMEGDEDSEFEDDDEEGEDGQGNNTFSKGGTELEESVLVRMAKDRLSVGMLRKSAKYQMHLQEVVQALGKQVSDMGSMFGSLEEDPEYKLVVACNRIIQEIDEDIHGTQLYVSEIYGKKFPELESLVANKMDYVKAILRIGNEILLSISSP